jgi:hypothetical protein
LPLAVDSSRWQPSIASYDEPIMGTLYTRAYGFQIRVTNKLLPKDLCHDRILILILNQIRHVCLIHRRF